MINNGVVKRIALGILLVTVIGATAFAGLQTFPIASDPSINEFALSAAFDGTNYLVPVMSNYIAMDNDHGFGSLKVQFVSQQGTLVGEPIQITSSVDGILDAGVAYGGGKYLLVWKEGVLCGQGVITANIKAVFITPDGVVGTPFTIASGHSSWNSDNEECDSSVDVPGVLYSGGKFFVVYEQDDYITCRAIGLDGTLGEAFAISQNAGRFHLAQNQIASAGSSFLVVYNNDDDYDTKVLARLVDAESGPVGSEMIIDGSSYPSDNPSSVIFDGEKYFVVWTDEVSGPVGEPGIWHFFGNFVSTSGVVSAKFPVSVVDGWKIAPFISYDGEKYLVTWTDGRNCSSQGCSGTGIDIYGQIVKSDGSLDGSEFVIKADAGNEIGGFFGECIGGRAFGLINTNLIVPDFKTDDVYGAFWTREITPPTITGVQKLSSPFRLKLSGANFHSDLKIFIGGDTTPWLNVSYKSENLIILKGGTSLKAKFPKGVPTEIKVVNGDGGSAVFTYTR